MVVEKAFAKLHGCYEALDKGHVACALAYITGGVAETDLLHAPPGRPLSEAPCADADELWRRLNSGLAGGASGSTFMGAGTPLELDEDPADSFPLVAGHAYAVVGIHETRSGGSSDQLLDGGGGGTVRYVRLRNPWGRRHDAGRQPRPRPGGARVAGAQRAAARVRGHQGGALALDGGELWLTLSEFRRRFALLLCEVLATTLNAASGWHRTLLANEWAGPRAAAARTRAPPSRATRSLRCGCCGRRGSRSCWRSTTRERGARAAGVTTHRSRRVGMRRWPRRAAAAAGRRHVKVRARAAGAAPRAADERRCVHRRRLHLQRRDSRPSWCTCARTSLSRCWCRRRGARRRRLGDRRRRRERRGGGAAHRASARSKDRRHLVDKRASERRSSARRCRPTRGRRSSRGCRRRRRCRRRHRSSRSSRAPSATHFVSSASLRDSPRDGTPRDTGRRATQHRRRR